MKQLKILWKSRTLRVSLLLAVLGALEASQGHLQRMLSPDAFGYIMIAIAVVMAYLRIVTTTALTEKSDAPGEGR